MRHFKLSEFDCKETGENKMDADFLTLIDELRDRCGFPFVINSGYRSKEHSAEVKKRRAGVSAYRIGTHVQGIASDVKCNSAQAYIIMKEAFAMGFTGIARGDGFVHLDIRNSTPVVWTY